MEKVRNYAHLLSIIIIVSSVFAKLGALTRSLKDFLIPQMANKLLPILLLEIVVLVLFIIPKLRLIGFLLMCSYLGGAIAVNYITGVASPIPPAIVLIFFWVAMYMQKQKLFKLTKEAV